MATITDEMMAEFLQIKKPAMAGKHECPHCGQKHCHEGKAFVHTNICQSPVDRFFCSPLCKENWCYRQQKHN